MNRSKESKKEIHIFYEIFVLCIIYCMPQNSGGKCVLTENIVEISAKIYDAIEPEELWLKIIRSIRDSIFCRRHSLPFHWIWHAYRKHRQGGGKIYEHASSETNEKVHFEVIWFHVNWKEEGKSFSRRTTRKLFQFAKIAHQSKTEFPQTISRNEKGKAKNVSCAFNQCYKVIYASCLRIQSEHIFLCDLNRDTRALLRLQLRENVKIERDAELIPRRSFLSLRLV